VAGLISLQVAPAPLDPLSGFLPVFVTPAAFGPAPPVAWCYGLPGWASTLALAGRARGRTDWLQASATLACQSLAPEQPCAGATLCHGASGLSLIAQRMAQVTGLAELRTFAGVWARRSLSLCEADGALDPGVVTEDELLTGRIGAMLALLAAATPVEPDWDRLLLLSGRPVPWSVP
jgi:lantibiotic biosynthesis protein